MLLVGGRELGLRNGDGDDDACKEGDASGRAGEGEDCSCAR